jgi:hypothetical protein
MDIRGDRVLLDDASDEGKNTILDAGGNGLHFNSTYRVTRHDHHPRDDN